MGLAFRLDRGLCDDPAGPRDAITDVPGVLVGHVTLRRGVDFQPHLRKIKESLIASRYPVGDEFN